METLQSASLRRDELIELAFLLLQSMLEEHDNWTFLTINVLVLHKNNHALGIHGFTCEELEIVELSEKTFHDSVDVLFEVINLIGLVVLLKVFNHLLHVVLQVCHVVSFLAKASLNKSVVEN